MSCISLPGCPGDEAEYASDLTDISWPSLVQGIRVYAMRQSPKVASELLELANLMEGIAELEQRQKAR